MDHTSDADDPQSEIHRPVLIDRVCRLLSPALDRPDALLIDATLGMAGHTLRLLQLHPQLRAIGIDRDPEALRIADGRLRRAGVADRVHLVHAVYDHIDDFGGAPRAGQVAGILFDLGVSSLQLDRAERGFAYSVDAPLDMRMDPTTGRSAGELLNTASANELARILRVYGEERFASRIAAAIIAERQRQPLATSSTLVELVRRSIPAAARRTGGNPAKRTFQALRIAVNDELGALERAIPRALDLLDVGGRLVALSYHSLEDRIVKRAVAPLTVSSAPVDLPVELPEHRPQFRLLVRGGVRPTEQETAENPRAASARLRAAERIRRAA